MNPLIQISDVEDANLRKLLDIVFGPNNFVNRVTVKTRSPSGFKTVNVGVFESAEYIYLYARQKTALAYSELFVETEHDENYNRFITDVDDPPGKWNIVLLRDHVAAERGFSTSKEASKELGYGFNSIVADFAVQNAKSVFRYTEISDRGASKETVELKRSSRKSPGSIFVQERDGFSDRYIQNGQEISFYSNKVREIDGRLVPTLPLTNIWSDIPWEGIANEGHVQLKQGKKPEKLVKRIIDLTCQDDDRIGDFFLGSGTTCAVAHKSGHPWLGIEQDPHLFGLALERLKLVLAGEQTGVSENVGWKGGGAFKYSKLEQYSDALAGLEANPPEEAMDKLEGFGSEYLIKYFLNFETGDGQTFMNIDQMDRPFDYSIRIYDGNHISEKSVDMLGTFAYLIGGHVVGAVSKYLDDREYRAVDLLKGDEHILAIIRNSDTLRGDDAALKSDMEFMEQEIISPMKKESAHNIRIFINSPYVLPEAETLEVEMKRLMGA